MGGDKLQILTECLTHKLNDLEATSTENMIKLEVTHPLNCHIRSIDTSSQLTDPNN